MNDHVKLVVLRKLNEIVSNVFCFLEVLQSMIHRYSYFEEFFGHSIEVIATSRNGF